MLIYIEYRKRTLQHTLGAIIYIINIYYANTHVLVISAHRPRIEDRGGGGDGIHTSHVGTGDGAIAAILSHFEFWMIMFDASRDDDKVKRKGEGAKLFAKERKILSRYSMEKKVFVSVYRD